MKLAFIANSASNEMGYYDAVLKMNENDWMFLKTKMPIQSEAPI